LICGFARYVRARIAVLCPGTNHTSRVLELCLFGIVSEDAESDRQGCTGTDGNARIQPVDNCVVLMIFKSYTRRALLLLLPAVPAAPIASGAFPAFSTSCTSMAN
jgi:hypothetical protein